MFMLCMVPVFVNRIPYLMVLSGCGHTPNYCHLFLQGDGDVRDHIHRHRYCVFEYHNRRKYINPEKG